jgi:DNA end-binding protein Ku
MATPSFFLTLGVLTIPVKAEAAARDKTIGFRNLHGKCGSTMNSQSLCVACQEVVPKDQQVKGYPLGRDQFVKIDPKAIEALDVENTKAMEIRAFVPMKDVDAVYLGASSFLHPVDQPATKAFELLRQAMAKRGRAALVQYVDSSREKLGLVRVYNGCLMLHEMFYEDEVRVAETKVKPVTVAPQELDLAVKLVKAAESKFEISGYTDTRRGQIEQIIAAQLEGQPAPVIEAPKGLPPVADLMAALKASVEKLEAEKAPAKPVAVKKPGKKAAAKIEPPAEAAPKAAA